MTRKKKTDKMIKMTAGLGMSGSRKSEPQEKREMCLTPVSP